MINVTEPFLPPKAEYLNLLNEVWERNWLTNNGPLVNELELQIKEFLNLEHFLFLTNGTIAIQLAIKALDLKGEIITTPFSYVATTSSIVWEGCKPVFVDIDPETFNINPDLIEGAITKKTSAILATHVYGNPCEVEKIDKIAKAHNLKVIYDAAHAFGTTYKGKCILQWGDISTVSFHATKLFHTVEGGGVVTTNPALLKRLSFLRNFGHNGPLKFEGVGINGKNSEFHAAMGLCNLKYVNDIISKRRADSLRYEKWLKPLELKRPFVSSEVAYNYAYFPVVFDTEEDLLITQKELEINRIFTRRYFYPALNLLDYVDKKELPITESTSKKVLCLPLSYQLRESEIDMICRFILRSQRYKG